MSRVLPLRPSRRPMARPFRDENDETPGERRQRRLLTAALIAFWSAYLVAYLFGGFR